MNNKNYTILSYYNFIKIKNIFKYKNILYKSIKDLDVKGIILIAPEGINLNVSVYSAHYEVFINKLMFLFKLSDNDLKVSYSEKHIFRKMKIKIKREILTTRLQEHIDINENIGEYIRPADWDSFINDPNILLIDTRNFYETDIGTFNNSINPNARNFTELLDWLNKNILKKENKNKKIAMFCTGGIRCEKATSYLKKKGREKVYHLQGGILKYLEEIKINSSWVGECFVFDNRVSLNGDLKKGTYELCYACRMPLSKNDIKKKNYTKGISCLHCYGKKTKTQINKYKMRNKQLKKVNSYE